MTYCLPWELCWQSEDSSFPLPQCQGCSRCVHHCNMAWEVPGALGEDARHRLGCSLLVPTLLQPRAMIHFQLLCPEGASEMTQSSQGSDRAGNVPAAREDTSVCWRAISMLTTHG